MPTAPTNNRTTIAVEVDCEIASARSLSPMYEIVPAASKARNIASMKPQSPMRLVTNAFLPAVAFASLVCQNEIRKYEQVPTPSHPRKVTSRFSPSTSSTIERMKRLR